MKTAPKLSLLAAAAATLSLAACHKSGGHTATDPVGRAAETATAPSVNTTDATTTDSAGGTVASPAATGADPKVVNGDPGRPAKSN